MWSKFPRKSRGVVSIADIFRRGHYGRALEDAISTNHNQWPSVWKGANPLHGGKNFNNMTPEERVRVTKAPSHA